MLAEGRGCALGTPGAICSPGIAHLLRQPRRGSARCSSSLLEPGLQAQGQGGQAEVSGRGRQRFLFLAGIGAQGCPQALPTHRQRCSARQPLVYSPAPQSQTIKEGKQLHRHSPEVDSCVNQLLLKFH